MLFSSFGLELEKRSLSPKPKSPESSKRLNGSGAGGEVGRDLAEA